MVWDQGVAGSNPVFPTIKQQTLIYKGFLMLIIKFSFVFFKYSKYCEYLKT